MASWLTRFGALVIDWFASLVVATLVAGGADFEAGALDWLHAAGLRARGQRCSPRWPGGSFGQIVFRLARGAAGPAGRLNLLQALARTALVLLVIPPLVFNRDNRGLHDLAVGTVVVRR